MQSRNISKVSLPRIKIKQTSSAVQRALAKFRTRSADFLKALSSFRWMATGEDVMFLHWCVRDRIFHKSTPAKCMAAAQ
jgi:hypothetical protein